MSILVVSKRELGEEVLTLFLKGFNLIESEQLETV